MCFYSGEIVGHRSRRRPRKWAAQEPPSSTFNRTSTTAKPQLARLEASSAKWIFIKKIHLENTPKGETLEQLWFCS
jgi:hypothetical protein